MGSRLLKSLVFGVALIALILGTGGPVLAANDPEPPRKIVIFYDTYVNQPGQEGILRGSGATLIKPLPIINGWAVYLPQQAEKALTQRTEVQRIDLDAVVLIQAKPTPTPPPETVPWGVNQIDADLAWGTNTGSGIKVAVLDTGIDLDHPDLQTNIKGGTNTINPLKTADDDNGHGTHVAGIIAGIDNDIGIIGVSPNADLYAVKVLDRRGSGFLSDIIEGIQWSIGQGIQVINMSFGTSSDVQAFHDTLITAYNSGITLVAAAGNSGPGDNTVLYPAKYTEVIAVSATSSTDTIASFSSRGTEVELAAPGASIYSTYKGGSYKTLNGTSMAAPHVTGTVALVLASGQASTPEDVRTILRNTADELGASGKDNLYGYGLVDAEQAATGVQTQ